MESIMVGLRGRTVVRAALATALTVAVSAFALVVTAAPALAHNSLTGSDPADGARLARPPATVRLVFLARLDPARTKVTVTGPDGFAAAGRPVIAGKTVTVPFRAGPAGDYEIGYEVPSSDGHALKGNVRFTLAVGAAVATTAPRTTDPVPTTAAPATTAGTPAERVDPDLAADAAGDDAGGGAWWPWALAVALVVVLLGAGGYLLRRRRA
jgi:methionine-rich copper-binding protein CopC